MDFARKILVKYGWKDGDGLGKNSDGIAKPLKATLKFDNAGFGADQAAVDFNNHWWERVFNEAASNVNIKREGDKIKMNLKDGEDRVEISTKGYSMKKLRKAKQRRNGNEMEKEYENFLQASTLTNLGSEVENLDKINANDIEVSKVKVLTDEELFKACGGRTAHKGARHGLKQSGKLSRIEQQEAELLAKMMAKRNGFCEENNGIDKLKEKRSKSDKTKYTQNECSQPKKKKKKTRETELNEVCEIDDLNTKLEERNLKSFKDKSTKNVAISLQITSENCKKKKKQKKLEHVTTVLENNNIECNKLTVAEELKARKNCDKEQKKKLKEKIHSIIEDINEEKTDRKKKKRKNL